MSAISWKQFASDTFDRQPTVLRAGMDGSQAIEAELFETLTSLPAHPWPGGEELFRFFDGSRMVDDPFRCLPRRSDGSFAGYAARARRDLSTTGEFGLVVNHLSRISTPLWRRTRTFLSPLLAEVGSSAGPSSNTVFLTSGRTPFGVHKDFFNVFAIVLRGPKRMLAWPYETLAHLLVGDADMSYRGCELEVPAETVRDEAVVLTGDAGDVLYWPATFWHVAEAVSETGYTLTLNVGLGRTQPKHALEVLTQHLMHKGVPPLIRTAIDARGHVEAPLEIKELARVLRSMADSGELENLLTEGWMEHVSATGYVKESPRPRDVELHRKTVLRVPRAHPILWRTRTDGSLAISANGQTVYLDEDRGVVDLIAELNKGTPHSVGELVALVERRENALHATTVVALLTELASRHALDVDVDA